MIDCLLLLLVVLYLQWLSIVFDYLSSVFFIRVQLAVNVVIASLISFVPCVFDNNDQRHCNHIVL